MFFLAVSSCLSCLSFLSFSVQEMATGPKGIKHFFSSSAELSMKFLNVFKQNMQVDL